MTGYEMSLPMNSGAEAVETALKLARKWATRLKVYRATRRDHYRDRQFPRANHLDRQLFDGTRLSG